MSVEIKWNQTPQQITDRFFDGAIMTFVHTRIKDSGSKCVPVDSGMLGQTVDITPKCAHYKSPYAHFRWEGKVFVDDRGSAYAKKNHSKHATSKDLQHRQAPPCHLPLANGCHGSPKGGPVQRHYGVSEKEVTA